MCDTDCRWPTWLDSRSTLPVPLRLFLKFQKLGACENNNLLKDTMIISGSKVIFSGFLNMLMHSRPALIWQLPVSCGYWALQMWLVQTEMCCKCKIHTQFWRLNMILYWVHVEMIIAWIDWLVENLLLKLTSPISFHFFNVSVGHPKG